MNNATEQEKARKAIRGYVSQEVKRQLGNMMGTRKMTVTTEYDPVSKKVGVTEAFGTEILLPTISTLSETELTVGVGVWVILPCNSWTNAIVFMTGNGNIGV